MAKCSAPSVIFIDEFESLASRRDSPNEHEATKRFKNELLIQIDELDCSGEHVLLLANTNLPWYSISNLTFEQNDLFLIFFSFKFKGNRHCFFAAI